MMKLANSSHIRFFAILVTSHGKNSKSHFFYVVDVVDYQNNIKCRGFNDFHFTPKSRFLKKFLSLLNSSLQPKTVLYSVARL